MATHDDKDILIADLIGMDLGIADKAEYMFAVLCGDLESKKKILQKILESEISSQGVKNVAQEELDRIRTFSNGN